MKLPTLFLTVAACALGLTVNAQSSVAETHVSHASRAIAMEVLIVRTNWGPNDERSLTLSGPTDEVAARLRDLESEGQILTTDRISLTTLENEETQIHSGKTTPVATARSFGGPGGAAQTSYQHQSVGTLISVTAKVDGEAIVVKLNVEKSQLEQSESKSKADDEFVPLGTETLTSQVVMRIENGKTVLASGLESRADTKSSAQVILASARILESSTDTKDVAAADGLARSQIKIVWLLRTAAQDAAALVEKLTDGDPGRMRVSVDSRTNSLIVCADDARQLDVVEAILCKLDERESWQVAETPRDAKEPDTTPAVTKYDEMGKQELQDELRRLHAQLIDAKHAAQQASGKANEAAKAYRSASDDEKADALLHMIEAEAASGTPMEHYREAESALDAAKQAYIRRILAE